MSVSMVIASPVIAAKECASCCKPANLRCSKCNEGVDKVGRAVPTHYCGIICQTNHWAIHKVECKLRLGRMRLWRAGELLREVAYIHARTVWHHKFKIEKQMDRTICMTPDDIRLSQMDYIGSSGDDLAPEDKALVLCTLAEDDFRIQIPTVMHSRLKCTATTIEEVKVKPKKTPRLRLITSLDGSTSLSLSDQKVNRVNLPSGEVYALSPTLARFDSDDVHSDAVTEEAELGVRAVRMHAGLATYGTVAFNTENYKALARVSIIHAKHRQLLERTMKEALQTEKRGLKLSTIVAMPPAEYQCVTSGLLVRFKDADVQGVDALKAQGGIRALTASIMPSFAT
nr:hypothetical protein B0A51_01929 [Rachicladosporium sp. CCFEE 5018]